MKKLFLASLFVMMSLVACDKINQNGNTPLNVDEQKMKFVTVADDLMNELAATEFEDVMRTVSDLYLSCESTFASDTYDVSALESVFEERYDAIYSYEELNQYTTRESYMLLLSNLKGKITFGKNAATFQNADNTVIEYTDTDGVNWTAELTPVGNVQNVYLGEFVDSWYNGSYTREEYIRITISVPEKLVVALKKNGTDYLSVTYMFDVAVSSGGLDVSRDRVATALTFNVDGLQVTINNAAYNASSGSMEASTVITKDGNLIFSERLTAEAKVNEAAETVTAKNINVEVDIMGAMQIKGSCPSLNSIIEIMDESEPQSERDWERMVNNMNTMFDIKVYFDGGNAVQSIVNFEPRWQDGSYSSYWVEPAIEFNDGSRYLFEEYFTGSDFDGVANDMESFVERYERLLNRYFDFIY
jgi:hypothetical protein